MGTSLLPSGEVELPGLTRPCPVETTFHVDSSLHCLLKYRGVLLHCCLVEGVPGLGLFIRLPGHSPHRLSAFWYPSRGLCSKTGLCQFLTAKPPLAQPECHRCDPYRVTQGVGVPPLFKLSSTGCGPGGGRREVKPVLCPKTEREVVHVGCRRHPLPSSHCNVLAPKGLGWHV